MATTGSLNWINDSWLRDIDHAVGRESSELPGPLVVVQLQDGLLGETYEHLLQHGGPQRLVERKAPWHSESREKIFSHCKLLVRQFWNAEKQSPYGWIYLGSHNLTPSAWGSVVRQEERELLWVRNRELGVLLCQPRGWESDRTSANMFLMCPLPFSVPPEPANLEGRLEEKKEEEEGVSQQESAQPHQQDGGSWTWSSTSGWQGWSWSEQGGWQREPAEAEPWGGQEGAGHSLQ